MGECTMRYLIFAMAAALFSGCATQYPCQEPGGISCKPVSAIYAQKYETKSNEQSQVETDNSYIGYPNKIQASDPVRTYNKTVRVWLAPWVDDKDVFHDQSFIYMVVHSGHWRIENTQRSIIQKHKAIMPKIKKPIISSSANVKKK